MPVLEQPAPMSDTDVLYRSLFDSSVPELVKEFMAVVKLLDRKISLKRKTTQIHGEITQLYLKKDFLKAALRLRVGDKRSADLLMDVAYEM